MMDLDFVFVLVSPLLEVAEEESAVVLPEQRVAYLDDFLAAFPVAV
jgi:hypothetical protein